VEIAKQGAMSRWGHKSFHKGNFNNDLGIDVDCYILDDDKKTAVISQSDMGAAIGLVRRGSSLPDFLSGEKIAPYLGGGVREKLENPIKFQWRSAAAHGFNIELLIDICDAIISADFAGVFTKQQAHIVRQANIIRTASAKSGIQNLAWRVAGYDPTREEVINAFKQYVAEEACKYKSQFPMSLFKGWCRLYNLRETMVHAKFSYFEPKARFRKLVLGQIYYPTGDSEGDILELILRAKAENPGGNRLFHYLTEKIGLAALRRQIGKVEAVQQLSDNKDDYEKNFTKVCGIIPPEFKV